jgi:hypothetical protein
MPAAGGMIATYFNGLLAEHTRDGLGQHGDTQAVCHGHLKIAGSQNRVVAIFL